MVGLTIRDVLEYVPLVLVFDCFLMCTLYCVNVIEPPLLTHNRHLSWQEYRNRHDMCLLGSFGYVGSCLVVARWVLGLFGYVRSYSIRWSNGVFWGHLGMWDQGSCLVVAR